MVGKTLTRTLCCLFVLTLACGTIFAQQLQIAPGTGRHGMATPTKQYPAAATIFTNLGPTPTNQYNAASGGYYVAGSTAADTTEQWIAVPFTAKQNSHATQLQAAVGWISGTKKVFLGIYSDNAGTVGTLMAQNSSTHIPNLGVCCQLVAVTIPSTALTAGTQYWLVATADDVAAPTMEGAWQASNNANTGGNQPAALTGWFTFSNLWPAGAVKGTVP